MESFIHNGTRLQKGCGVETKREISHRKMNTWSAIRTRKQNSTDVSHLRYGANPVNNTGPGTTFSHTYIILHTVNNQVPLDALRERHNKNNKQQEFTRVDRQDLNWSWGKRSVAWEEIHTISLHTEVWIKHPFTHEECAPSIIQVTVWFVRRCTT